MAKKYKSSSSSLKVILALFIIFFVIYVVSTNNSVAIINKNTTIKPVINTASPKINPIFVNPIGVPSVRRTFVDVNTYTPNVDVTPFNPRV